ncbi:MAG: ABC transporter permease [Candidatus Heimdallarchaeaceae archaeon]
MDKSIAISLKVVGFIFIIIATFLPIYTVSFVANPHLNFDDGRTFNDQANPSSGQLIQIFGARIDYKTLSFLSSSNTTAAFLKEDQVPSNIVIMSAALWFIVIFAILFAILGQVFQSGGFQTRGFISDIVAALLLLLLIVVAVIAMDRSFNTAAEKYNLMISGHTAVTPEPLTLNPNEQLPSYFDLEVTGKIGVGLYFYLIGIFLVVTAIFLPVDWTQESASEFSRRLNNTRIVKKVKEIATMRLTIYVTRRLLTLIPLFIAISVMTFAMVSGMGDPVALLLLGKPRATEQDKINLTRNLGLDQPVYARFILWFYKFLHGDMGTSYRNQRSINEMIGELVWETLKLQLASFVLALLISIPLGIWAAKNQNTWIDTAASTIALLGLSMPIFVFGLVLIYLFSGNGLGILPAAKAHGTPAPIINWETLGQGNWHAWWSSVMKRTVDSLLHMTLPTIALTFASLALYTRLVRSTMLEVLRQDYILAARANGLSERVITWKHAFRNVLIPVVTYVGLFLASALAGAPITETLFTWPGLGYRYVVAVNNLDFPMILGTTAVLTILILIGNLVTDIAYVAVDPRIEL